MKNYKEDPGSNLFIGGKVGGLRDEGWEKGNFRAKVALLRGGKKMEDSFGTKVPSIKAGFAFRGVLGPCRGAGPPRTLKLHFKAY